MGIERITTRAATPGDARFVYEVKRAALGPYITQVFGWDEAVQQAFHAEEYQMEAAEIVLDGDQAIGWVASHQEQRTMFIDHIYLLPAYHGRGVGRWLLERVLRMADAEGCVVKLDVLKINPARHLYERCQFTTVGENAHFYHMERQPQPPGA